MNKIPSEAEVSSKRDQITFSFKDPTTIRASHKSMEGIHLKERRNRK